MRISPLIFALLAAGVIAPGSARAAASAECTILRASISFANPEAPVAIDGRCCGSRMPHPTIALSAHCEKDLDQDDPTAKYCEAGSLGSMQLSAAELIPSGDGCADFHAALPLHPDLRFFWEQDVRVVVTPGADGADAAISLSVKGMPDFALLHAGFDTDAKGVPIVANLTVNQAPPVRKVKFAFLEDVAVAQSGVAPSPLPPTLLEKWKAASSLDAECLQDATCGQREISGWNKSNIPLPACRPGILIAGLVFPGAGDGFIDAVVAASRDQNGGRMEKRTKTPLTAEEEWQIALVEGGLALGLAHTGYLFIDEGGVIDNNFIVIAVPTAPACNIPQPRRSR